MTRNPWVIPLTAAATITVASIAAATLLTDSGDTADPALRPGASASSIASPVGSGTDGASASSTASGSASSGTSGVSTSASATTSATPTALPTAAVPVYWVADMNNAPRLYREFHRRPIPPGDEVGAAIRAMLSVAPNDPDYTTLWPRGTTLRGVKVDGSVATVNLSGFPRLGSSAEAAAVQQVVYTATAADRRVTSVRLLVNGKTPASGHLDLSAPQRRSPPIDVQSWVWILSPDQGSTLTSPVPLRVYGTGFEGNTVLRFYAKSRLVAQTIATTAMGTFAEGHSTVKLPPGTYEMRAYTDSGEDSTLTLWDTKTFTVR